MRHQDVSVSCDVETLPLFQKLHSTVLLPRSDSNGRDSSCWAVLGADVGAVVWSLLGVISSVDVEYMGIARTSVGEIAYKVSSRKTGSELRTGSSVLGTVLPRCCGRSSDRTDFESTAVS